MDIFDTIENWRQVRRARPLNQTLGFVPTMGNLHAAHLSLITRCQHDNTDTVVSLFVNQTQFNRAEDFANYPRTLEADLTLLERTGVRYCLIPPHEAMYPDGFRYQLHETTNHEGLEGKNRPGHFTGVLTVVMKLLQWVAPHQLYLGEKDYEQAMLIRGMVDAFLMDVHVNICPTMREASGLAYSSRNNRLSPEARLQAAEFAHIFHQATTCDDAITALNALGVEVEYLEEHAQRRFAAVHIGGVRLIDNYAVAPHSPP